MISLVRRHSEFQLPPSVDLKDAHQAVKCFVIVWIGLGLSFATAGTMPQPRGDAFTGTQQKPAVENLHRALPLLREGDIIFISRMHPLYRRLAETSGSWESHVGILLRNSRGAWTVAQSTIPVSNVVPLERFVGTSENGRFLVRRLRGGLPGDAVDRLRAATSRRMGVVYDSGFNYDSPRQYCSKFVFGCFSEATGQQVGKVVTFREMLAENPGTPVAFWRAWFLGRIPWERRCVTTTSQLRAPNMVTVFDSEKTRGDEAGQHPRAIAAPAMRISSSGR